MKVIFAASSLLAIFLSSNFTLAADYTIAPGQTIRLGSDTVSCQAGGGGNPDLFVGYRNYNGCEENGEVTVRFLVDWSDKKQTEANCEKNGIKGGLSSYKLGNEPCKTFVNFNYCYEIVRSIFGD